MFPLRFYSRIRKKQNKKWLKKNITTEKKEKKGKTFIDIFRFSFKY